MIGKPVTYTQELAEKCAVFGVYAKDHIAARLVCTGLWALQHRGQEATGISVSDGKEIKTNKGPGHVTAVHTEEALEKLIGHMAIGHNRYSTFGSPFSHFQPVFTKHNLIAVAHNGNLPTVDKLRDFLKKNTDVELDDLNDSELIQGAIEHYMLQGMSVEEAIKKSFPLMTGAFALVMITKDKIIGLRDA